MSEPTEVRTLDELRRLLHRARVVADSIAKGVLVDAHYRKSCAVLGDNIAEMIGHAVTDQPPAEALEALTVLVAQKSPDAEALGRVLALADEFDAQVPWPHSWIGNRIREAAGAGYDQGEGE